MMRKLIIPFFIACLFSLCACSSQGQQRAQPQVSAPRASPLTNPSGFPLMRGSTVLDVKPFTRTVAANGAGGLASAGAGKYAGTEVLAVTPASEAGVRTWLRGAELQPPAGYVYRTGATSNASVKQTLDKYDVDYAVFTAANSPNGRTVAVVVMDPKVVKAKLGIALDLVEQYRSLPESLRAPIDSDLKAKAGFSATEATDPSAPLGMTLSALEQLRSSDKRAIILLEASKM